MSQPKLENILEAIGPRLAGEGDLDPVQDPVGAESQMMGTVAVIPVMGTLVHRHSFLSSASGMTSYEEIRRSLDAAVADPLVDAILLDVDSGGGAAAQCFDLVDAIYKARGTKPIWAVANDSAMSGAYAIASAADQIVVTRTSNVGSIGVIIAHADTVKADADAGLNYTIIRSGERKAAGNPHEPLTDETKAEMQDEADRICSIFVETVARNRGVDVQVIRSTEAAVYAGPDAVTNGLADKVMTFDEAVAALAVAAAPQSTTAFIGGIMPNEQIENPENAAELNAVVPTPAALAAVTTTPDRAAIEASVRAEMAEINTIADQARRLGVNVDVSQALTSGTTPDALRRNILSQLENDTDTQNVVATPSAPAGTTVTPDAGAALDAALGVSGE